MFINEHGIKQIEIGDVFGNLTVIEDAGYRIQPSGQKKRIFKCKCKCGNISIISRDHLITGHSKSCGHCNEIKIGNKYGKLTVLSKSNNYYIEPLTGKRNLIWVCQCECGNIIEVVGKYLTSGNTKSCGCLKIDLLKKRVTKHKLSNTRIYHEYINMKQRCCNPNNKKYPSYGGRGIVICDEWLNEDNGFMNFYNWAISHGYRDDLTIDRINVNGNYEPNNCRWAPNIVQSNNTRRNNNIEYNGTIFSLMNWCRALGQNYNIIRTRLYNNYSIQETLFGPSDNPDPINAICFIDEYGMPVPQDKVSGDDFVN